MLRLNTRICFQFLLKVLRPDIVCDVGSMDTRHSQMFRRVLPKARIIAFEANPRNAERIRQCGDAARARIELQEKAVASENGTMVFHLETAAAESGEQWRHGASSLRERVHDRKRTEPVEVPAVRLDTVLAGAQSSIALWIDVEGAAYEVLGGIEGIARQVMLIHVEVETREIWRGQKLAGDVDRLLDGLGFVAVARGKLEEQHDVIYLPRAILDERGALVERQLRLARRLTLARKYLGNAIGDPLISALLHR